MAPSIREALSVCAERNLFRTSPFWYRGSAYQDRHRRGLGTSFEFSAGCRARSRALTMLCSATPQRITAPPATRRLRPVVSEPTWRATATEDRTRGGTSEARRATGRCAGGIAQRAAWAQGIRPTAERAV